MIIRRLHADLETLLSKDVAAKAMRYDMAPPCAAPDWGGVHQYFQIALQRS